MKKSLIAFLALTLTSTSASAATGDAGTGAADFLRIGVGAAPAAQGEAYTARSATVDALHYNPAGLAGVRGTEIELQHNNYLLDMSSEYAALARGGERFSWGASFQYLDHGDFTRRTISNPGGAGAFKAGAMVASLGAAWAPTEKLSVGTAIRYFDETIDNATRTGVSADVGLQVRPWGRDKAEFGLVLKNLGRVGTFDQTRENLPMEFRAAATLPLTRRVKLAADVGLVDRQGWDIRGGVEFLPVNWLALRGGYDSRNNLGSGMTLGAGLRLSRFALDYAYTPFKEAGAAHRVSMTHGF